MVSDIREIQVKLSRVPADYAVYLGKGFDTVEETFDLSLKPDIQKQLEEAKERAKGFDLRNASKGLIRFAGVDFLIYPYGGKGFLYFIETNDYKISIGNPSVNWGVSVQYFSKGLWSRGYDELRAEVDKVFAVLMEKPERRDYVKLRRADIAFDLFSKKFSAEMVPGMLSAVVALSGVKKQMVGSVPELVPCQEYASGNRLETITIGSKSSLQIQIYNKTAEIRNSSNKTWLFDVWRQNGTDIDFENDVWRVEFRFFGKFMRERNIETMADFRLLEADLMEEALLTRRLTKINRKDSNRARWALHPVWSIIYRLKGEGHCLPVGRVISLEKRKEIVENLKRQVAGGLRSAVVLAQGEFEDDRLHFLLLDVLKILKTDPEHETKVVKTLQKYRFIDEAK